MPTDLLISSTATTPFRVRPREVKELDLKRNRIRLTGSKDWLSVSPADIPNLQRAIAATGRASRAVNGPFLSSLEVHPLLGSPGAAREDIDLPQEVLITLDGKEIECLSKEDIRDLTERLSSNGIAKLAAKDTGFGLLVLEVNDKFAGAFAPVKDKATKDWAGANYYIARALIENGRILEESDVSQLKTEAIAENKKQLKNPELCPKNADGTPGQPQSIHLIAMGKLPKAGRSLTENRAVQFERITKLLNEAYQASPEDRANILVKARGAITQNPADKTLQLASHVKLEAQNCIERGDPSSPEADELLRMSQALDAEQQMGIGLDHRQPEIAHSL